MAKPSIYRFPGMAKLFQMSTIAKNSQIIEITEFRYPETDDLGKRSNYKKSNSKTCRRITHK